MPAGFLERATGFEPVAFSLARRRSTTEPRPRTCCLHVKKDNQCQDPDLNWGHLHFQCSALPTELSRLVTQGEGHSIQTGGNCQVLRPIFGPADWVARRGLFRYILCGLGEWLCPGGCPGLQNQWPVAPSERRWVRLPSTPAVQLLCLELAPERILSGAGSNFVWGVPGRDWPCHWYNCHCIFTSNRARAQ